MTQDDALAHALSEPAKGSRHLKLVGPCKYGENPCMTPAEHWETDPRDPLALHRFTAVEGTDRSFINLTDADSLLQILTHLAAGHELNFGNVPLMAAGVKHGNACGAAVGDDAVTVIRQMIAGDKRAIFGGVIMTNFPITRPVAEALMEMEAGDPKRLFDGVFAPSFDPDAPEVLKRYEGKCRMMANPALGSLSSENLDRLPRIRQIRGGFLKQPNYTFVLKLDESDVPVGKLSDQQRRDIITAWAIGCVSNSNTITLVRNGQLIGNGVGQQDRVGAAELALKRAHDAGHGSRKAEVTFDKEGNFRVSYYVEGAVAWSDSFFPAPDGPEVLARAGVTAIFASSGSKFGDKPAKEVCERYGVTLVWQPDAKVRGFAKH